MSIIILSQYTSADVVKVCVIKYKTIPVFYLYQKYYNNNIALYGYCIIIHLYYNIFFVEKIHVNFVN